GTAGPWPQYRHNARRTGRAVAESLSIALSPQPKAAVSGETVTLSVVATGTGPLTYQWFRDGQPVPAATTALLTVSATAGNVGNYAVAVTGPQGTVVSAPAPVTVRGPGEPEIPG